MIKDADRTVIHYRYVPAHFAGRNGFIACDYSLTTTRTTMEQSKVTCKRCKRIVGIL